MKVENTNPSEPRAVKAEVVSASGPNVRRGATYHQIYSNLARITTSSQEVHLTFAIGSLSSADEIIVEDQVSVFMTMPVAMELLKILAANIQRHMQQGDIPANSGDKPNA